MLLPSVSSAKIPQEENSAAIERAKEANNNAPLWDQELPVYEKYSSEDTLDDILTLLYPTSGRFEWVFSMGEGRWGKHKITPKEFDWKNYESKRFEILSYDTELASEFAPFAENVYEEFGNTFDMHKFDWKNIVALYNTRMDFEQTRLWPGLVPEGLGGFTFTQEEDKHKIAFLMEGSKGMFYRIGKHELHHRFSIEKLKEVDALHGAQHEFPMWLEEGGAEFGAIGWDAQSEMFMRDAYFNDYFVPITQMDYILRTWLMYKEGQFVSKVIAEHFGKEKLITLRENTKLENFDENLKASVGISFMDLDKLVNDELSQKYAALQQEHDFVEKADALGEGTVMANHGNVFVIGETWNTKHPNEDKLYLMYMDKDKRFSKEIERDHGIGRETLHHLANSAALDEDTVAYGIRSNESDILVFRDFTVTDKKFKLEKTREYRFDNIEIIKHPVFVKEDVYFIGYDKKGYPDLYQFHEETNKLEKVTNWRKDINSLVYSEETGKLLLSIEDNEKGMIDGIDYNYNLYTLDPITLSLERLTETKENETRASFASDGKEILFTSDKDNMFELYAMDLETKKAYRVSHSNVGSFHGSFISNDEIVFHSLKMMSKTMHRTKIPSLEMLKKNEGWNYEKNVEGEEEGVGNIKTINGELYVHVENHDEKNHNEKEHDEKVLKTIGDDKVYLLTKDAIYVVEEGKAIKWETKEKTLDDVLSKIKENEDVIASDVSVDGERLTVVTNNILSFNDTSYPVSVAMYDKDGKKLLGQGVMLNPKSTQSIKDIYSFGDTAVLDSGELLVVSERQVERLFKLPRQFPIFSSDTPINKDEEGVKSKLSTSVVSKNHGYVAALVERSGEQSVMIYKNGKMTFFTPSKLESAGILFGVGDYDGEVLLAPTEIIPDKMNTIYHYNSAQGSFDEVPVKAGRNQNVQYLTTFKDEIIVKLAAKKEKKSLAPDLETLISISASGENKVLVEDCRHIDNLRMVGDTFFFDVKKPGLEETYLYDGALTKAMDVADADLNLDILTVSDKNTLVFLDIMSGKKIREEPFSVSRASESELSASNVIVEDSGEKVKTQLIEHPLSKSPFFQNSFSGYGAWAGGKNFMLALDYTGKDMLQDHVVNTGFLLGSGYFILARAMYADLDKGYTVNTTADTFGSDIFVGTSASKIFTQSKYLQIDIFLGYLYAHVEDQIIDFEGDNHVVKGGFGIGYDTTKWGILGPKEGVKLFASSETGWSVNHQNLSNVDVNTEERYYWNIIEGYLSMAFRTAAGTSIGEMPTLYLMGGNNTLRGVPFGSEGGNNYLLGGTEIRADIISIAGIMFKGALEPVSVITLFPEIELGLYADAGDAWYANSFAGKDANALAPFDFKYSVGYMVNVPTLYGFVFRFSKGFIGEKGFNFWFGADF